MKSKTKLLLNAFILVSLAISVTPVFAHKVNMFAFAEGNEVFVEGYFTDGIKPKNSAVTVFDSEGSQLLSGLTNAEGQFSFAIPKREDLRITLNAGEGHMTEYTITREELEGDMDSTAESDATGSEITEVIAATTASPELQAMIKKAVGQSLRPVMRSLSELKEQRSFSDIVGGLGFIVGIIGGFFYFKARKLLDEKHDSEQ